MRRDAPRVWRGGCGPAGVFVTVSICLSTVCVITSILVLRINAVSTRPLPSFVRLVAFHYVAWLLCVPVSAAVKFSRSSASVVPGASSRGRSSRTSSAGSSSGLEDAAAAGNSKVADCQGACCCRLKPQFDSVLFELRKVNCISIQCLKQRVVEHEMCSTNFKM